MIFAYYWYLVKGVTFPFRNHKSESILVRDQIQIFKNIEIMHKDDYLLDMMSKISRFGQRISYILKRLNHFIIFIDTEI